MHVEAHDLVKTYPPSTRALDGLSFAIAPGEVFGLLGPNGAGKSTAISILTTLARPTSGSAYVAGHDVLRHPGRVRRAIGVVAQKSGLDPAASGRDNLVLQGRLFGMGGTRLKQRVNELFARFDLAGAADRAVRTYSGGMRRRLDVALGLVHRPSVLFLDEPTTGLDPEARTALWQEIAALSTQDGLTILLTTHYLEEADRLTDRLTIVDRGRTVVTGTADALKGELKGDAVHIGLRDEAAESVVRQAIGHVVRDVTVSGRELSARADDGAAAVPGVLAALDRAGIPAASVTVARPSLDDVYLRHVGRRFSETDASGSAASADAAQAVPGRTGAAA